MPERRSLLQNFKTRPRCCTDVVGVIYAVGGLTPSGGCGRETSVGGGRVGVGGLTPSGGCGWVGRMWCVGREGGCEKGGCVCVGR